MKTYGCSIRGIEGVVSEIRVTARHQGFQLWGIHPIYERETRLRVRSALDASRLGEFWYVDVTVVPSAASPASLDLAIAVALLRASKPSMAVGGDGWAFLGELALDGRLRPSRGTLPMALAAKAAGLVGVVVHPECAAEALGLGIDVRTATTLRDVVVFLDGTGELPHPKASVPRVADDYTTDFADIVGCARVKRALEVAAVGGHHMLITASRRARAAWLARALSTILPDLTEYESVAVTSVYSASGMLSPGVGRLTRPPVRIPHHTASRVGMLGGGDPVRAGEASLAHCGVLVLDDLPEFPREVTEALEEPLAHAKVTLIRARERTVIPAKFICVGVQSPCPCSFADTVHCQCTEERKRRYLSRHPDLTSRMLLRVTLGLEEAGDTSSGESSAEVRSRVVRARRLRRACSGTALGHDPFCMFSEMPSDKATVCSIALTLACVDASVDQDGDVVVLPAHVTEALALTGWDHPETR